MGSDTSQKTTALVTMVAGKTSVTGGGRVGGDSLHAHYVSRRYAEFTCSILLILNRGWGTGSGGGGGSSGNGGGGGGTNNIDRKGGTISTRRDHLGRSGGGGGGGRGGGGGGMRRQVGRGGVSRNISMGGRDRNDGSSGGKEELKQGSSEAISSQRRYQGGINSTTSTTTNNNPKKTSGIIIRTNNNNNNMNSNSNSSFSHRGSAGDMLVQDLSTLLEETVSMLTRLSEEVHPIGRNRAIFLVNNYDTILSVFRERRVSSDTDEVYKFNELLAKQREVFVEEELLVGFSRMIAFVQQTEGHMARIAYSSSSSQQDGTTAVATTTTAAGSSMGFDVNVQVVENLVSEFSSTWRAGIAGINRDVLSFFSDFRNGTEILKQVLTQLLLYYTRFQDIIRKVWSSPATSGSSKDNKKQLPPPSFRKDIVGTAVILSEIKKYALAI